MQTELPYQTFKSLLIKRDFELYQKWLHNGLNYCSGASKIEYSTREKDILWCVSQQARRIANCKEK